MLLSTLPATSSQLLFLKSPVGEMGECTYASYCNPQILSSGYTGSIPSDPNSHLHELPSIAFLSNRRYDGSVFEVLRIMIGVRAELDLEATIEVRKSKVRPCRHDSFIIPMGHGKASLISVETRTNQVCINDDCDPVHRNHDWIGPQPLFRVYNCDSKSRPSVF